MNFNGKDFNDKYYGKIFIKLTNETEIHNNFQFQNGLNIDTVKFACNDDDGGIYFCEISYIGKWIWYSGKQMVYVRFVTIPDDAQVYVMNDKIKTDKMILSKKCTINDLDYWRDKNFVIHAVNYNGHCLRYIKNKLNRFSFDEIEQICLNAVKQNGYAIRYVVKQTYAICLEAVCQDGCVLQYVQKDTGLSYIQLKRICLEAVMNDGNALQFVDDQTTDICLQAVRQNKHALHYVKDKTMKNLLHEYLNIRKQ
jgi:hypothetical protein